MRLASVCLLFVPCGCAFGGGLLAQVTRSSPSAPKMPTSRSENGFFLDVDALVYGAQAGVGVDYGWGDTRPPTVDYPFSLTHDPFFRVEGHAVVPLLTADALALSVRGAVATDDSLALGAEVAVGHTLRVVTRAGLVARGDEVGGVLSLGAEYVLWGPK